MASRKGAVDRLAVMKELQSLEQRKKQLLARLERGDSQTIRTAVRPSRSPSMPVRDVALNALEELDCLAFSRELMLYVDAWYGREIPAARFGTLSKDEQTGFDSDRPRPVFLAHGLTSERFEAIKRLWGRSDWPLWRRIVAPTTGRIQHLEMTLALCNIALSATDRAAKPEMLKILAADHARDLPGVVVKRGQFPLDLWRDTAAALLEQHAPADRQRREEAAKRFEEQGLSDRAALFGAPEAPALYEVAVSADR